jgi:hypothetical protein
MVIKLDKSVVSKISIILNVCLVLLLVVTGTFAAQTWTQREVIHQTVTENSAVIKSSNFTMPSGTVGVAATYNKTSALVITTSHANMLARLSFTDSDILAAAYSSLSITLCYANGTSSGYILSLVNPTIQLVLQQPSTYSYTYKIDYLPLTSGTNDLSIDIVVSQ